MNKFEEIVNKISPNDSMKNIKITIANKSNEEEEKMDVIETSVIDEDKFIDLNLVQNSDDETEFHVNLDKVPPSLQNTILNEKIYLNEIKNEESKPDFDLDFISEPNLSLLYDSLNLSESNFVTKATEIDLKNPNLYRKDSIHVFGANNLKTEDIFEFFASYKPFAIEWIDDSRCNVVWKNETHAANALLHISQPYEFATIFGKREILPPQGSKWRRATNLVKGKFQLYMRFVRLKTDRKIKGAESRSKFYVKHGNPNYGNLKGFITESKRKELKMNQIKQASNGLESEEANGRNLVSYEDVAQEFGTEYEPRSELKVKAESRRSKGLYSDEIDQSRKKSRFQPYSREKEYRTKSNFDNDPNDLRNKLNRIKALSSNLF